MLLIDALKQRIASTLAARRSAKTPDSLLTLKSFSDDIESILRDIDYQEVTAADKITFIELAVDWQVRRVLACGRFDLAVELRRFGVEQMARYRSDDGRPLEDQQA